MRGIFGLVAAVGAGVLLVAGPVSAGPPTEQLRGSIDRVVAILNDPALKGPARTTERRDAIRRVLEEAIDFDDSAQRALGPHWRARSEAERKEFTALFRQLVEYSYILRIEPYAGEPVVYTGESIEGDHATVRTKILTRRAGDLPIEYRMQQAGARWLVYDVAIEGVSLVANYRSQFNTIIQTSSYPELIARIKTRLAELAATPAPKAMAPSESISPSALWSYLLGRRRSLQ